MATLSTDDGVKLYYEETGSGMPIVFVHEFAGDYRTWEPQVRHFSRRYRCIAYNARGYPPSDVPADVEHYSQQRARDDIRCVLDQLGIEQAHIVGNSMGGFAALHFGMHVLAARVSRSLPAAATARIPINMRSSRRTLAPSPRACSTTAWPHLAATYGHGPGRLQLQGKDPRRFAEFDAPLLGEHSAQGSANTMLGYQARRPSLYDLKAEMARIAGARVDRRRRRRRSTLEPSLLMKRTIPTAASARAAQERAHDQSGRSGAVQSRAGRFLPPSRGRALDAARVTATKRVMEELRSVPPSPEALSHLRVIDLTRVRAGPTCVKQFADWGADVIKIEMPALTGEDSFGPRQGSDFQNLHRNKRSLTLNLKDPRGVEVLKRLVKSADILVENYRPDVKHKLGIDYETLGAENPALDLCEHFGLRRRTGPIVTAPASTRSRRAWAA